MPLTPLGRQRRGFLNEMFPNVRRVKGGTGDGKSERRVVKNRVPESRLGVIEAHGKRRPDES